MRTLADDRQIEALLRGPRDRHHPACRHVARPPRPSRSRSTRPRRRRRRLRNRHRRRRRLGNRARPPHAARRARPPYAARRARPPHATRRARSSYATHRARSSHAENRIGLARRRDRHLSPAQEGRFSARLQPGPVGRPNLLSGPTPVRRLLVARAQLRVRWRRRPALSAASGTQGGSATRRPPLDESLRCENAKPALRAARDSLLVCHDP